MEPWLKSFSQQPQWVQLAGWVARCMSRKGGGTLVESGPDKGNRCSVPRWVCVVPPKALEIQSQHPQGPEDSVGLVCVEGGTRESPHLLGWRGTCKVFVDPHPLQKGIWLPLIPGLRAQLPSLTPLPLCFSFFPFFSSSCLSRVFSQNSYGNRVFSCPLPLPLVCQVSCLTNLL